MEMSMFRCGVCNGRKRIVAKRDDRFQCPERRQGSRPQIVETVSAAFYDGRQQEPSSGGSRDVCRSEQSVPIKFWECHEEKQSALKESQQTAFSVKLRSGSQIENSPHTDITLLSKSRLWVRRCLFLSGRLQRNGRHSFSVMGLECWVVGIRIL
jgi:hypothetical protein